MKALLFLTLSLCCVSSLFPQSARVPLSKSPKVHDPDVPESLTFVVSPGGFGKSEMTVERGIYSIAVFNHTGGKPLQIQLDRVKDTRFDAPETPERVKVASGETLVSRAGQFLTTQKLTPGTYRLSVAEYPNWVCTITVK